MTIRRILRSTARAIRLGSVLPLPVATHLYGGTDKWLHGYMEHYQRHLSGMRWKRNRILEIGVGGYGSTTPGGSLRIWRDCFSEIVDRRLRNLE